MFIPLKFSQDRVLPNCHFTALSTTDLGTFDNNQRIHELLTLTLSGGDLQCTRCMTTVANSEQGRPYCSTYCAASSAPCLRDSAWQLDRRLAYFRKLFAVASPLSEVVYAVTSVNKEVMSKLYMSCQQNQIAGTHHQDTVKSLRLGASSWKALVAEHSCSIQ